MITDVTGWVHNALPWVVIIGIMLGWWMWHSHRYPKVRVCRHCDVTGSIHSRSPILGRPVTGPCRWCGGEPWRTRVAAPTEADRLTPGYQWRVEEPPPVPAPEWCWTCFEGIPPNESCPTCGARGSGISPVM